MPEPGLTLASVKPVLSATRLLVPWASRHPFVARPLIWHGVLVVWFCVTVAALMLGVTYNLLFLGLIGGLLAFVLAGLFGWHRLRRPAELRALVFLAEFEPATPGAHEASR